MNSVEGCKVLLNHKNRKRLLNLKPGTPVIVGRSPDAEFFLNAPSLSRRHCAFIFTPEGVVLEDLQSRNGCYVNNQRITRALLTDGMAITLGKIPFTVEFLVQRKTLMCPQCGALVPEEYNDDGAVICRQCWAIVAQVDPTQGIAEALADDGYQVLEVLSSDPPVFKVERTTLKRVHRVKALPLRGKQDPQLIDRFINEARVAANLRHPHILQVNDVRQLPNLVYILMDWFDGQTLEHRVKSQGPMDLQQGLEMALEICDAIGYASSQRIVHGQIAPRSVFLTSANVVKLTDFSLALDRSAMTTTFDLGDSEETEEAPLAPELYMNVDKEAIDVRADLFGLGVVLLYALTGHGPYPKMTALQLAREFVRGQYPAPDLSGLPDSVFDIIARLLEADISKRYQTVTEVKEELETFRQLALSGEIVNPTASFSGMITGDELIEYVQMAEFTSKSGVLTVRGVFQKSRIRGTLYLKSGRIVDAEEGAFDQATAVRRILGTRKGTFNFTPQPAESMKRDAVNFNINALLLDIMRAQDEAIQTPLPPEPGSDSGSGSGSGTDLGTAPPPPRYEVDFDDPSDALF